MSAPPRILIAEDEKVSLLKLKHFLNTELAVETLVAQNGEEAWEIFQNTDVQFVISDWEMPLCDGPELCRRVRQLTRRYTYFIMLTAREREEDLLAGMASGADDFVRKPPNFEELKSRIKAGFRVLALEQRLAAQNARLESALHELQSAVTVAALVQQRMLPDHELLRQIQSRTGISIAYEYVSCESLGGDVLSVDQQDDGQVVVFLGDVSGHGIAASLAAVSLNAFFRANLRSSSDPLQLIGQANQFCCSEFPDEVYASSVLLKLNPRERHITSVIAGHPPLLKLQADGKVTEICSSIPPLGLFPDAPAATDVLETTLAPGDRVVAYTDGIIETRNPQGDMFAVEQLVQCLRRARNVPIAELPAQVLAEMDAWRGPQGRAEDDVTVAAIEFP